MFENLNERMAELKEKGRQKEKWEQRLKQLKQEVASLEHSKDIAKSKLAAEEKDVDRLTGMSLSNTLYTILGKKMEKLDEEQREAVVARLKYEEADRALQDGLQQISQLERQLQEVRYWKNDYDLIFRDKEKQILQENEELMDLAERQAVLTVEVRELEEAVRAGHSVQDDLARAEEGLQSARNWGTYDMLGGGMLSTHIKHNRLDEAMDHIYAVQNNLRRFEKELKDVGGSFTGSGLEVGGLLKFSDYFFDGLITDWLVQGRIKDALEQVQGRQHEVNSLVSELQSAQRRTENELETVRRKYVQSVELYQ
ncbi:hypothetical protein DFP94_11079 [Fontibacillus phaseoli]|uniref:Uncharacterized protein n=1 Tax=Fontibacillus phaseoli TaxID=1416533 RepID=A0A369B8V1_9BACL|nr:hypothetical protein [Fontibacillus phaseoli]RCX17018.1 hypothetical protein DFP94_11079 [Fontibacillus phaseoli]